MPTEKDKLQKIGQAFDQIGSPEPANKSEADIQNMLDRTLDGKADGVIGEEKGDKNPGDSKN